MTAITIIKNNFNKLVAAIFYLLFFTHCQLGYADNAAYGQYVEAATTDCIVLKVTAEEMATILRDRLPYDDINDIVVADNDQMGLPGRLKKLVLVPIKLLDTTTSAIFNTLIPIVGAEAKYCDCPNNDCFGNSGGSGFCCSGLGQSAQLFNNFKKTHDYSPCADGFSRELTVKGSCGSFRAGGLVVLTYSAPESATAVINKICYEPHKLQDSDIDIYKEIFAYADFQEEPEIFQPSLKEMLKEQRLSNFIKDFARQNPHNLEDFLKSNLNVFKEYVENIVKYNLPNELQEKALQVLDIIKSPTHSLNTKLAKEVFMGGFMGGSTGYVVCELAFVAGGTYVLKSPQGTALGLVSGNTVCPHIAARCAAIGATVTGLGSPYLMEGDKKNAQSGGAETRNVDDWSKIAPSRPLEKMGHAQKHLKDFQGLDSTLSKTDIAKILEYVRKAGTSSIAKNGGKLYGKTISIQGKDVMVKVVESSNGIIKTGYPVIP